MSFVARPERRDARSPTEHAALIEAREAAGMTALMQANGAPTAGLTHVTGASVEIATRREGPVSTAAREAARELDVEVARLLRVRGGELAEPLLWQRPSHRAAVELIVGQLAPIRSRVALMSSWERESRHASAVRLAYAIVWLRLAQRRAAEYRPRGRQRARLAVVRGRG
jgi:hypothetical protein